jgi:hypothetical protein
MQRELAQKKHWFFFELRYPHKSGSYQRIFFSAEFLHPEAAIRWSIKQRAKIIELHSIESPKDCRSIIFRFLAKDEVPPRWANIDCLKNAESANISQIFELTRS